MSLLVLSICIAWYTALATFDAGIGDVTMVAVVVVAVVVFVVVVLVVLEQNDHQFQNFYLNINITVHNINIFVGSVQGHGRKWWEVLGTLEGYLSRCI